MNEKIAILTSQESWFRGFAEKFAAELNEEGYHGRVVPYYKEIWAVIGSFLFGAIFRIFPKEPIATKTIIG